MNQLFVCLARWSVDSRRYVICLLLALSAVATVGYVRPTLFRNWWQWATRDSSGQPSQGNPAPSSSGPRARPPENVNPLSLSNSDAVLVVECPEFFTPRAAEAMRFMVAAVEELDQVQSVLWLDRVPLLNIFGLPQPLLPPATASANRFAAAKATAIEHPLIGGRLLSDDTRTMLLLVSLNYYHVLSDADVTSELREAAQAAADRFPDVALRVRVTGRVPSMISAIEAHEQNQLKYQLIGYGMILLMSVILFRGIRSVAIVALAPAIGVFWTLGFTRFLGYDENPLIDVILPILVSLVALTDGVHLMVQIRKLRAAGQSRQSAAKLGLEQVGLACFLTSLTTAIGFGSLTLANSEWVRQFGICSTIGVLLSFVAVVTVIPLACSSWLGNKVHIGHEHSLIDRHLERISGLIRLVLKHRKGLATISIVSTGLLAAVALSLRPDQRVSDGLPESAEATQALVHIDRSFGGLEFSQVDISWSADIPSDAPDILLVLQDVDRLLSSEPLIGHPLSLRNLIDAQPGSGPPAERMSLLELLPPPLKRAFYTPETRNATVTFRVQDLGIARYGPVFSRIEAGLVAIAADHPGFQISLRESGAVWRWKNLYQIVVDLAASLGSASIIILIVLTCVYRSMRLGLISVIPNIFPLALTGAFLVVAGYNLEIVMVCSFTICLGISVDDTIHFLTRYQEELPLTDSNDLAIQRAFTGVGTALIMTTLVLVAGFSIVTFSDSRDHKIFATMGALTISAALVCDLVFLPALLSLFAQRRR